MDDIIKSKLQRIGQLQDHIRDCLKSAREERALPNGGIADVYIRAALLGRKELLATRRALTELL